MPNCYQQVRRNLGPQTKVAAEPSKQGIHDFSLLVAEMTRVLRPGGLIILIDIDYRPYTSTGRRLGLLPYEDPDYSWMPVYAHVLGQAMQNLGVNLITYPHLVPWMQEQKELYDVQSCDFMLPMHPWHAEPGRA